MERVRLKFGTTTARLMVAILFRAPDVPVIVMAYAPAAAALPAVTVMVLVVVALAGLKDDVMPAGNPEAARFTFPLKPFRGTTVIVLVPLLPGLPVVLAGAVRLAPSILMELPIPTRTRLFTAIQQTLGLRLETARTPLDALVIDTAQRPTEN